MTTSFASSNVTSISKALEGAVPGQLCFGSFHLIIRFESEVVDDLNISITDKILYKNSAGIEANIDDPSRAASILCNILGDRIKRAGLFMDRNLELHFESGTTLLIMKNSDPESFRVSFNNQTIVI
jgi:hypothetical protein